MEYQMTYKGYQILKFEDDTFDINQGRELIDGGFKSCQDCKDYIDVLEAKT